MSFDFTSYLRDLEPSTTYSIKRLTGGLINFTVRATRDATSERGRFSQHQSLVLKYAPPFVAAVGEKAPFSQSRQNVEVAALSFLAHRDGSLHTLDSTVLLPELLHYDENSHVIIMTDLGDIPSLNDFLETDLKSSLTNASANEMGSSIGKVFAKLHSVATYHSAQPHRKVFDDGQEASHALITQFAVSPIEGHLQRFDIEDAAELQRRVKTDFEESYGSNAQSFILGDSWPGAILVKMQNPISVGFIDWEFAGFGRGVHGDIAQMLAHLTLHLRSETNTDRDKQNVTSLIMAMIGAYRQESQALGVQWAIENAFSSAPNSTTKALRSTTVLIGREIINNTIERDWTCRCCPGEWTESCSFRRDMIDKGVWYLRIADVDDAKFCARTSKLLEEDWMLRLLFSDEC